MQRQQEAARSGEAGDLMDGPRFPSIVVGNGQSAEAAALAQQRTAAAVQLNGTANNGPQQQMWNAASLSQAQQQQLLAQAARRQNISPEDMRNLSPAMRQSLINSMMPSVAQAQAQQQGAFAAGGAAALGRLGPGHPQYEQALQQRLMQQRALQGQAAQRQTSQGPQGMPANGVAGAPQGSVQGMQNRQMMLPPGAVVSSPAQGMHPPGTPSQGQGVGTPGATGNDSMRRSVGPGQPHQGPQQQQQSVLQQQQQPQQQMGGFQSANQPPTPGGSMPPQQQQQQRPEMAGQSMLPDHLRNAPLLNQQQHNALVQQYQQLQENMKQEGAKAQFAPNQAMAQQFYNNVQSLQSKALHIQHILKAQPALQQQAAQFAQQQVRDNAAAGAGQMSPPATGASGGNMMQNGMLSQQQRAQLLAAQQQQQQQNQNAGAMGMNGQQQRMQQPGQQQMGGMQHPGMQQLGGGNDFNGMDRPSGQVQFMSGNPFISNGQQQLNQGGGQLQPPHQQQQQGQQQPQIGMGRPTGPPGSGSEDQQHQQQQQQQHFGQGGPPPRPGMQRTPSMMAALGGPSQGSVSSPSPRNTQPNKASGGAGPAASPALTAAPNTPKTMSAEAAKKKKEPRARKNSRAVKTTPQLSAATPDLSARDAPTPQGQSQGGGAGGPQALTPANTSNNLPTPSPGAAFGQHQQQQGGMAKTGGPSQNGHDGSNVEAGNNNATSGSTSAMFEGFGGNTGNNNTSLDGLGVSTSNVNGSSSHDSSSSNMVNNNSGSGLGGNLTNHEDFSSLFASSEFFDFDAVGGDTISTSNNNGTTGGATGGIAGNGNFDWDLSNLSGMFGNEIGGGA